MIPIPTGAAGVRIHSLLEGRDGDQHSGHLVNAPASSARNLITSGGAAVVPLTVRGAASQTGHMLQIQNSASGNILRVEAVEKTPAYGFTISEFALRKTRNTPDVVALQESSQTHNVFSHYSQFGSRLGIGHGGVDSGILNAAIMNTTGGQLRFDPTDAAFLANNGSNFNGLGIRASSLNGDNAIFYMSAFRVSNTTNTPKLQIHASSIEFYTGTYNQDALGTGTSRRLTIANNGSIDLTPSTALTSSVNDSLIVGHNSSGTPAANFGTGILLRGKSSTTDSRDMGRIRAIWTTATDASRASDLIFSQWNTNTENKALQLTGINASGQDYSGALFGRASRLTPGNGLQLINTAVLEINYGTAVSTDTGFADLLLTNTQSGTSNLIGRIMFANAAIAGDTSVRRLIQISVITEGAVNSGAMQISTNNAGTFTERIRITKEGRLGIGTSSPSALLDVDSDTIRLRTAKTPASAAAAGNAGDFCWDASYFYICIATNTWRRVAHATW